MKNIEANETLVAFCGLYCGCCKLYLEEKCPGCIENKKSEKWCKLKLCCKDKNYRTCADCKDFTNTEELKNCKKFNNIFSKIFSFLFKSDRYSCIKKIKEIEIKNFADFMTKEKSYNSVKKLK